MESVPASTLAELIDYVMKHEGCDSVMQLAERTSVPWPTLDAWQRWQELGRTRPPAAAVLTQFAMDFGLDPESVFRAAGRELPIVVVILDCEHL